MTFALPDTISLVSYSTIIIPRWNKNLDKMVPASSIEPLPSRVVLTSQEFFR